MSEVAIQEPSILTFIIKRLLREMIDAVGVTVAWSTSTRFSPLQDEDEDPFSTGSIRDPKTAEAVVPAIGILGPTVQRDQLHYTAHQPTVLTEYVAPDGLRKPAHEIYRPPWYVDLNFDVTVFHNRKAALVDLAMKYRQFVHGTPYIVIPASRDDVGCDSIPDKEQFIEDFWKDDPPDRRSEGTVIAQELPLDETIMSFDVKSNNDDLYTVDLNLRLENIELADECIQVVREPLNQFNVVLFNKDDPCEIVQSEFTVEGES